MLIKIKLIQAKFQLLFILLFLGFSMTSQNNVGVNTSTPNSSLEVQGNGDTDATSGLNVTDSAGSSSLFVRDDGRVGIGVTTPGARFMVIGKAGAPAMNILPIAGAAPSFRINDDGKVGVGTTTPGAKFMVVGEAGSPTFNVLHDGANPMNPGLRVNENGRVGIGTITPGARFMVVGEAGAPAMNILPAAGSTPSLRVNDDGKVGVGTTAPGAKFMVVGEAGSPTFNVLHDGTNPMNPALRVNEDGRVGIGTITPGARFMVVGEAGAPAMNILPAAGSAPALRVNDNGRVGVGTAAPAFELDVVGDINASGNVRANGMVLSSDKRYKANIQTLNNSLAILAQVRGTSYWWKDQNVSEKLQIGFIAQELESILPNLVHTDKNGYKAVNYIGLIPVMTEAIKEQQSTIEQQNDKIDAQNERIEVQDERIENLEARLQAIETLLKKND